MRVELKLMKKGNKPITEFVLRIKVIVNSLLVVGDLIIEKNYIYSILNGLLVEYSPFVMQIYGFPVSPTLCEVEALLYAQEVQLDNSIKSWPRQPLL